MTKISAARRAKSATVHVKDPATGKVKGKYPVDSAKTARSAVKLINNAKPPLTPAQKATVLRKAAKFGAKPASAKKASK
jgi:acyl-CoA reductase-like NAD-dependent aldehyde dehydrogenase